MSGAAVRYLIELRDGRRPVDLYLHAFEDDERRDAGTSWNADARRALRFKSKADADAYIFAHVDHDAVAAPFTAAELVGDADQVFEDEVADLSAC